MKRAIVFAVACVLAACASEPKAPPAPVLLTDAQYQEVLNGARNPSDAFQEERNYTALMAREDLTPEQKWRAQYLRAVVRGTTAYNLTGSIADYQDLLTKLPPEHRLFKQATDNLAYGQTQRGYIERRLANPASQKPTEHVDDMIAMGRWEDAKAYIKQRNVSVTDLQAEKFVKLKMMCEGEGYRGARWGADNTGYHTVGWCDAKQGPEVKEQRH